MKIHEYLADLGFPKKEADIYLTLFKLGTQPASVIAKYIGMERTYVYKILLSYLEEGLVSVTEKNGVKQFFIPDISILKKYLSKKREKYTSMEDDFHLVEAELAQYSSKFTSSVPKITIRD